MFHFLCTSPSFAEEPVTIITSDTLEYISKENRYVAKGSVFVEREDVTVQSDEMIYHEDTDDVTATGNVRYDDSRAFISAGRADLNMERKTGTLYDAEVFFKDEHFHLSGKEIEKRGEKEFFSRDKTRFTTCDGPVADWCFQGRNVDLVIGHRLKAEDASFLIRDVPIFYTPHLWAPVLTERQTGFLMPLFSNSNSRGFGVNLPFFWAIAENRDATFVLDAYSKRGIGTGLEYRFLEPGGVTSSWWIYNIRDRELDRNFTEVTALHENRYAGGFGGFLAINFVNEKDFYREFNPQKEKEIQRFLESTGEFSIPLRNARTYLLSQYWVDLKNDTGDVPQKLPELGYVLHYARLGSVMASASVDASNFWRKNGISAMRLDVYPKVLHSVGTDVVLSQAVAVRGTGYSFYGEKEGESSTLRTAFEYDGNLHTRLYRKYESLTHIIEPSIRYRFISSSDNDLPLFDAEELYRKKSKIDVSVLNRILVRGREAAVLRITQGIDTYNGDRPFVPLKLELGISRTVPIKLGAAYDVNSGRLETLTSEIWVPFPRGSFAFGQRYNRDQDIMVYKSALEIQPMKRVQAAVSAWYDAEGEGLTNLTMNLKYTSQCWGVRVEAAKKPGDFTVMVLFDLAGITSKSSGDAVLRASQKRQ